MLKTEYQLVHLPEAATVVHRSRTNRAMRPSISVNFESEVSLEDESGSLGCEALKVDVSLSRSKAAMTVTAKEQTTPVF